MFYLQVPDIDVPIFDVEDSALVRLKHFATYAALSDKPKYIEYLKNSSLLDYAGFLCLRTHASLTENLTLKYMISDGEARLMEERLKLLKPNYLRKYLIKIIEDIELFDDADDTINVLLKVCSEYKYKQHEPCDEECRENSIEVPWQKCLTLVTDLKVHLVQGVAVVPCGQWNSLLVDLFRLIYNKSLHRIRRSTSALAENNLQVEHLSDRIDKFYYSHVATWTAIGEETISLEQLDSNKKLFPPCMLLSLNSLFANHRLAHDPRYRLTLFFKEIGVPIDQTLALFKQEYSKCDNLGSACTHTWDTHCKQIEYNVQHTYGLIGSKKNYNMTPCASMHKLNPRLSDEGCCPFVHCSEDRLKSVLEEFTTVDDEEETNVLNDLKNSDQPVRACHWYANKLFETSTTLYHYTPAQFFFNSKKRLALSS